MKLRATSAAEAALLATLHAEAFPPPERWGPDAITLMLEGRGGFGIIATGCDQEQQALGFALGRAIADEAEILTLAVRPAARRQGVGRALLQALTEQARALGAKLLFLEVAAANRAARSLYAAAGAEPVGTRRGYYADGDDALVLRLSLSSE